MTPPLPSRDAVVAICAQHGPFCNSVAYNEDIWIKYGTGVTQAEAILQQHIYATADPRIFRTPQVYDYFTQSDLHSDLPITYIVMQRVYGTPVPLNPSSEVFDQIAAAARHLWDCPLPAEATIGPLAGQIPYDWFFSDYGARRTFQNVTELEEWINDKLKDRGRPDRITLSSEVHICHGDLSPSNVLLEPLNILDWGRSGIYPRIFEEYALFHQFNLFNSRFVKALHKRLFKENEYRHLRPLALVANINAFGYCY